MGNMLDNLFSGLLGKDNMGILMVGLDNVGKTTILYKLKLGKIVTTIPTIGKCPVCFILQNENLKKKCSWIILINLN